jgi:hypothetical protein
MADSRNAYTIVALAASIAMVGTAANADALTGDDVRTLIAGKTIALAAPFGSLPIRYSAGGTMVARSTAMKLYAGIGEDRGTWWIAGNRLCQKWDVWHGGKQQCFSLSRTGTTVHWQSNDGMSGTAYAMN